MCSPTGFNAVSRVTRERRDAPRATRVNHCGKRSYFARQKRIAAPQRGRYARCHSCIGVQVHACVERNRSLRDGGTGGRAPAGCRPGARARFLSGRSGPSLARRARSLHGRQDGGALARADRRSGVGRGVAARRRRSVPLPEPRRPALPDVDQPGRPVGPRVRHVVRHRLHRRGVAAPARGGVENRALDPRYWRHTPFGSGFG